MSLFALLLFGCRGAEAIRLSPTSNAILYFSETGHTVQPPFLSYYRQHNGIQRLGNPITEALDHEGWRVQYFQYGRLEVHPENQPDYFITVGWLGELSHRTQPPIPKQPDLKGQSRYFPHSGHTLNGDFLRYFEANGGTVQFGRPISEAFLCGGVICQDLQSARFIWRPRLPPSARVQLEPLGETYFLSSALPLSLLNPLSSPPSQAEIIQHPKRPLPQNSEASLSLEETPRPGIIRVTATLLHRGQPVAGYSPRLLWSNEHQSLPPTRSNGQTHTLVDTTGLDGIVFTLYDQSEGKALASVSR